MPVTQGDIIDDRYLVGPVIGEGGMGIVCAATHLGLAAPVALKLIRPDLKDDPEFVQRFMNEAKAAAALKGEHIATVHDVGRLRSGEPYLIMEQLDGIELDVFVEQHAPLDETDAVELILQVCDGLEEAHAVGLIHRDIKPANLFLTRRADGHSVLKILDFGISKSLLGRSGRGLTNPDRSLGSPWYMSPEQMTNASRMDQRTDIWSVGVLLFELLTGSHPFDGSSVPEVCAKVLTAPASSLGAIRPNVDARVEAVVSRCLEKNPDNRYHSVSALAEDLRAIVSLRKRLPLAFARTEPVLSSNRDRRRGRTTLGSLAAVAAKLNLRRRPISTFATVALASGVALTYVGWTLVELVGDLPQGGALSRISLPGDPVLSSEPEDVSVEHEWSAVQMLLKLDSTGLVASSVTDTREHAEPSLTPEEIHRRTKNYQDWLRDHGLRRLEDVDQVNASLSPGTRADDDNTSQSEQVTE